jgi:hypothetical protein
LATNRESSDGKLDYQNVDAADRESCRPDFAVAIYPGHLSRGLTTSRQLMPICLFSVLSKPAIFTFVL